MKRLASVLVCVGVAMFGLVACSDDGGDSTDDSQTPTEDATEVFSMVGYNVLHGLDFASDCAAETAGCAGETRLEMMWELVENEAGCPDVIALQEVSTIQTEFLPAQLETVCDGKYELVSEVLDTITENWVLSSLPVLETGIEMITGALRTVQWIRFDSEAGPFDFYNTHFVAGIDNFDCAENDACAPAIDRGLCDESMDAGACNPHEILDYIERTSDPDTLTVLAGDLNAEPTEARIVTLTDAGFVDVWSLADLPECDPDTGESCTSGQGGEPPYGGLDVVENLRTERIDLVLVRGSDACEPVVDESTTGRFAGTPFDPPRDNVVWPSDHIGVMTTISCA